MNEVVDISGLRFRLQIGLHFYHIFRSFLGDLAHWKIIINMECDAWNIRHKASIMVNGPFSLNDMRFSMPPMYFIFVYDFQIFCRDMEQ